jgi:hypothetical protein
MPMAIELKVKHYPKLQRVLSSINPETQEPDGEALVALLEAIIPGAGEKPLQETAPLMQELVEAIQRYVESQSEQQQGN